MAYNEEDKQELLKEICRLITMGNTEQAAFESVGVGRTTFYEWKKQKNFSNAIKRARAKAQTEVVTLLVKHMREGKTSALIYWLNNRAKPDKEALDQGIDNGWTNDSFDKDNQISNKPVEVHFHYGSDSENSEDGSATRPVENDKK